MRSSLLLIVAVIASCNGNIHAQVPSYVPQQGLVGWWPLDGSAFEASKTGFDSQLTGAIPTANRRGEDSKALRFNGDGDVVITQADQRLHLNQFTLSAWVKIDRYLDSWIDDPASYIIGKGSDRDANGGHYSLHYRADTRRARISVESSNAFLLLDSRQQLDTNRWYCIVGTWDGRRLRLYLDGLLQADTLLMEEMSIGANDGTLTFGQMDDQLLPYSHRGAIDDIGVWNRALSSKEVEQLSGARSLMPKYLCEGLVAQYEFDGNLEDSGHNQLHAKAGSVNASVYGADRHGVVGKSATFDGTWWAYVDDDSRLRLQTGTISCWFKTTNRNASNIVYKTATGKTTAEATGENYSIGWYGQGDTPYNGPHGAVKYNSNCVPGNGWIIGATNDSVYSFADDLWHHLVVRWDSLEVTTWFDGQIRNQIEVPGVWSDDCEGSPLLIGRGWNDTVTEYLKADLDDLCIWNRTLTDEEIHAVWNEIRCNSECYLGASADSILGYRATETHQVVTYALRNDPDVSYQWIATGGYLLGETTNHYCDVIWGYGSTGSVCCIVSDSSCTDTICVDIEVNNKTTGIAGDGSQTPQMSVQPNPTSDMIDIASIDADDATSYTLLSVTGEVMKQAHGVRVRMNVEDVPSGVYHVIMRNAQGVVVAMQRVVVQK